MKFQIGDKIEVIADRRRLNYLNANPNVMGEIGEIIEKKIPGYRVKFPDLDNYCWWFGNQDLRLFEREPETKPTNPKDALAIKKAPLSTLPTGPMYEVALAMLEGARKYGRHNYRVMGVKASVYYDAAMGHLTSWWEGEDIDPASGLPHLAKAIACIAVVRDSMMMKNWVDDRPPRYPDASELMRNNPIVGTILEKYPDCKEPYTELNKNA